jgi:hypothetical protein
MEQDMTKDEALDLALEALYPIAHNSTDDPRGQAYKAITAIKQSRSAPVQEPVADVYMAGRMKTNIGTNGRVVYVSTVYSEKPLVKGDKLYTTPPAAQRQWVGLSDEEMNEAMDYWSEDSRSAYGGAHAADGEYVSMISTWRYIEAKLKEKNNG